MARFTAAAALALAAFAATPAAQAAGDRLTVVLVGDTGMNASGMAVHPDHGFKWGRQVTVAEATAHIAPWLKADITIANLETVVTDRNDIPAASKRFTFRSHPKLIAGLAARGINVFSAANNHAMDHGQRGAGETLRHLAAMPGLLAFSGVAHTREAALTPAVSSVGGTKFAFAAIGLGGWGLPAADPYAGALRFPQDFGALAESLGSAEADLRILSVHYGSEFDPWARENEKAMLRRTAAMANDIDIVMGHHKHVANGVELVDGRLVFYGLGNFLHPGTQNMGRHDICHDFGLLARITYARDAEHGLTLETVEAVPLTDMHLAPRPLTGEAARLRLAVLNHLAGGLDDAADGATGLRFTPEADGTGLWCAPGAADPRCASWAPPPAPDAATSAKVAAACRFVLRR